MTEDGRKHLEFIEQVVTRMNSNSFQLKGWSVTLVAGLFALAVAEANKTFAWLAIIPILVFWLLDAYYLGMERSYRDLYDKLRDKSDHELRQLNSDRSLYCMRPSTFGVQDDSLLEAAGRPTVAFFHGSLLASVFILSIVVSVPHEDLSARDKPRALASMQTAPLHPVHPLDPLTAQEFATLKEIISTDSRFAKHPLYVCAQLEEPPKDEVLDFRPGREFRREAIVVAISREEKTAYEVLVDLKAKKMEPPRRLEDLQPYVTNQEFDEARKVVDSDPEVRSALLKLGYRLEQKKISDVFFLDAYAPGKDPHLIRDGKTIRAIRVLFADRLGGTNDYGPYVEGLMALVDVYEGKLVHLYPATGVGVPKSVPEDIFDQKTLGPRTKEAKLRIGPPTIDRLKFDGNHVRWENWNFRYDFNQREGLVLHQIAFGDQPEPRSICYRASVSEMFVPYSDPSESWIWREFFDAGEYGLGYVSVEANAGKDLPENALTLDAVLADESLDSKTYANRVFFYERDGGALFAHTQTTDDSRLYARAKELVVGFVAAIGNYDYIFKWVFREDGSFGFEAELQGLILNKTVDLENCQDCASQLEGGPGTYRRSGDAQFGTLVSPNIMGIFHQHWINLRLDFDIDGQINAVKECNTTVLGPDPAANPCRRAFTVVDTIFATAAEAERVLNLESNRVWLVYNPAKRTPTGEFEGYEIDPLENTKSVIPESRSEKGASFTQRHFWVTQYHANELYAAGKYPNQAPPDSQDDLYHYAQRDESIYNQDIVVWYSLGFTHITKPEDYPIMPGGRIAVNFVPRGFFAKSPALGYATIEKVCPHH